MPGNGFIVIDRKIQDWEWHDDSFTAWMFINLLLLANWKDGRWHGRKIPRGSLITSRSRLSDITGQDRRTVARTISGLQSTGEISVESAGKFMIIRINNYSKYQDYLSKNPQDHVQVHVQDHVQVHAQENAHNITNKQSNKVTREQEKSSCRGKTRNQGKEANHAEPERKPEESEYTPEALRRAGFSPIESADDFERMFGVTLTDEERNIGKK